MMKTLTKIFGLIALLIIPASLMAAKIAISEIGFRSSPSSDDFVELYNPNGTSVNLNGYKLIPSSGTTITFTSGEIIPANGFLVISKDTSSAGFQASWGVSFGADVDFYNSNGDLSTTAGVTFILRTGGGNTQSHSIGYPVVLGTRRYACPIGKFQGNTHLTDISSYNPGSVMSLGCDDLTHWTLSRYNDGWQGTPMSSSTGSDNLIVKNKSVIPVSTDNINDVLLLPYARITATTANFTISGDLFVDKYASVTITSTGIINVSGTINQYKEGTNTANQYNLWCSPFSSSFNIVSNYPGVNHCDLYTYKATTQEWKLDFTSGTSINCANGSVTITSASVISAPDGVADGNMDLGRGYFIPGDASTPTRTLTGTSLNNGNINIPVYGSSVSIAGGNDWNLIGNPYPSAILASSLLGNANNDTLINSVYIYNPNGSYTTLNSSSSFNISSCQGFFTNATSTTDGLLGNIQFTNSMRTSTNWYFRNVNQTIFCSLTYDSLNDPLQIILDDQSEDNFDNKHDAYKLPNWNGLNFASYIDSELFVFNGIKPIGAHNTKTVKLFVEAPAAGSYSINLDSLNLIDPYLQITLQDMDLNKYTDMRTSSYSFTTSKADSLTDRFYLHLTNNVNSVSELDQQLNVSVFTTEENIEISALGNTTLNKVEVFDVLGKQVWMQQNLGDHHQISTASFVSGIYIVKVQGENGQLATQRVFVQ